jgi:hypothetical protein
MKDYVLKKQKERTRNYYKKYGKKYYQKNKDKIKKYNKEYYKKNRDKILAERRKKTPYCKICGIKYSKNEICKDNICRWCKNEL